jgi:hypothetical protein
MSVKSLIPGILAGQAGFGPKLGSNPGHLLVRKVKSKIGSFHQTEEEMSSKNLSGPAGLASEWVRKADS